MPLQPPGISLDYFIHIIDSQIDLINSLSLFIGCSGNLSDYCTN